MLVTLHPEMKKAELLRTESMMLQKKEMRKLRDLVNLLQGKIII